MLDGLIRDPHRILLGLFWASISEPAEQTKGVREVSHRYSHGFSMSAAGRRGQEVLDSGWGLHVGKVDLMDDDCAIVGVPLGPNCSRCLLATTARPCAWAVSLARSRAW